MNSAHKRYLTLLAVALLAGCVPEKRVVWSPDGTRAAVVGADGLYLTDPSGKLSPRLLENVTHAAWLPDSKHIAVTTFKKLEKWDQLVPILDPAEKRELIRVAEQIRTAALAYSGDWDKFHPDILDQFTSQQLGAGFLYIRDKHSEGLPARLGHKWEAVKMMDVTITSLKIIDASTTSASSAITLTLGLPGIQEIAVAPNAKDIAYTEEMAGESNAWRLMIAPAEASTNKPSLVADRVGRFAAWSPDSQWLAFMHASVPLPNDGSTALRLGSLARRQVCSASGNLLEQSHGEMSMHIGNPDSALDRADIGTKGKTLDILPIDDLAGIIYVDELNIHWLHDGRIVFVAMDVHLPSTSKDMPTRLSLFSVDPDRQATVSRLLPRDAESQVGDAINFFEFSPDEKRLAIPGKNGTVSVLTLATGEVKQVQPDKDAEDKLRTLPTWRTNDELCLAIPKGSKSGSPTRPEIALWSPTGTPPTRAISTTWPDHITAGLLTDEKKSPSHSAASQRSQRP